MNYLNIHNNLIELCQAVSPAERLRKRRPNDVRLNDPDRIYTEKHHIVPKHDGGTDDVDNLVALLPEEHYLIHLLRWKALKYRGDYLACKFIETGFIGKSSVDHGSFLNKLGVHKQFVQEFRRENGWQSEDGRKRISKARKGKIPVVDAITREMMGAFDKDHPKIVSGEWVHHTTGKSTYIDESGQKVYISTVEAKKRGLRGIVNMQGSNNSNYRNMDDDAKARIYSVVPKAIIEGHFKANLFMELVKPVFPEYKSLSHIWFKNNYGSWDGLVDEYNRLHDTDFKFNRWYRFNKKD